MKTLKAYQQDHAKAAIDAADRDGKRITAESDAFKTFAAALPETKDDDALLLRTQIEGRLVVPLDLACDLCSSRLFVRANPETRAPGTPRCAVCPGCGASSEWNSDMPFAAWADLANKYEAAVQPDEV